MPTTETPADFDPSDLAERRRQARVPIMDAKKIAAVLDWFRVSTEACRIASAGKFVVIASFAAALNERDDLGVTLRIWTENDLLRLWSAATKRQNEARLNLAELTFGQAMLECEWPASRGEAV